MRCLKTNFNFSYKEDCSERNRCSGFKSDLINLGEEIQYKLELTMEELRGPLYVALMQQSSALTLMYCAELIESQGSPSLESFSREG